MKRVPHLSATYRFIGRPGENRTLVDRLKAEYSSIELRAHLLLYLVVAEGVGLEPTKPYFRSTDFQSVAMAAMRTFRYS